jgi:hypothetical protein
MVKIYDTYRREDRRMQDFGAENRKEEATIKVGRTLEENINRYESNRLRNCRLYLCRLSMENSTGFL